MAFKKRVRIIKKIRPKAGEWKFISMRKIGNRYVWDKRPGYFVEWWDRSEALQGDCWDYAKRGKRDATQETERTRGELLSNGKELPQPDEGTAMAIQDAITNQLRSMGAPHLLLCLSQRARHQDGESLRPLQSPLRTRPQKRGKKPRPIPSWFSASG